jgi:hypothetical protein
MAENKKTIGRLPIKLEKAVLENSAHANWEQAVAEWDFYKYYYNDTQLKKYCPCSPREIKHITVIKNRITKKLLEIDNQCAEVYFKITEGKEIKYSVQRLSRNIDLGMNRVALNYLWKNRCIGEIDYNNYEIVLGKRESKHPYSERMIQIRQKTNKMLVNYTKYGNCGFFIWVDYVIAVSEEHPDFNVASAIAIRQNILINGNSDKHKPISFMEAVQKYSIDYSEEKRNEILDKHFNRDLSRKLTKVLDLGEYCDKITHLTPLQGLYGEYWNELVAEEKEKKRKNKMKRELSRLAKEQRELIIENEVVIDLNDNHLTDGLEDGIDVGNHKKRNTDNSFFVEELKNENGIWNNNRKVDDSDLPPKKEIRVAGCYNIEYHDRFWDEEKFIDDEFAHSKISVLKSFYQFLYEWVVENMVIQEVVPDDELTEILRFSLQQVVNFINIPEITRNFDRGFYSSFQEMMSDFSIKYSYQLLDLLIRNSKKDIKSYMVELLENFLRGLGFKLIHNKHVTRFVSLSLWMEAEKNMVSS